MTDPIEDRLRSHLTARADGVHAKPDPTAFVERSANRDPRRGLVAGGLAALTVVVAGAGVLTGVNLSGASASPPTSAPAPSPTGSGRNGAAFAPNGAGASPSIVVPSSYSFLFTRVSASGVTVRAYTSASGSSDGCAPAPGCSPSTTIPGSPPCPMGALCAQPIVVPHTSGGTGGSSGSASSGPATVVGPNRPAEAGGGTVTTVPEPSSPVATCGQLLVELSTDRAVGTGSLTPPISPPSAPDAVVVLGTGSFGSVEGAPVSWVAVSVGGGIATVRLTVGGTPLDAMAPVSGVVVLTATGGSGLAGASLVGVDQSGATVATTPAVQSVQPGDAGGCPPTTPPPSAPPPTIPATTTTTTAPPATTTTAPPTTTTTGPPPVPTGPPVTTGG